MSRIRILHLYENSEPGQQRGMGAKSGLLEPLSEDKVFRDTSALGAPGQKTIQFVFPGAGVGNK